MILEVKPSKKECSIGTRDKRNTNHQDCLSHKKWHKTAPERLYQKSASSQYLPNLDHFVSPKSIGKRTGRYFRNKSDCKRSAIKNADLLVGNKQTIKVQPDGSHKPKVGEELVREILPRKPPLMVCEVLIHK